MKKQSIALSVMLIFVSGLQGTTLLEIQNKLNHVADTFTDGALHSSVSTAQQNQSLEAWDNVFNEAKIFVLDNNKNLIGAKDTDIINALNGVEQASIDFINAIKTIRGLSDPHDLQKQSTYILSIKNNLKSATAQLRETKMTLDKKNNAKNMVLALGTFLKKMIDGINEIIIQKMKMTAPIALPPVSRG